MPCEHTITIQPIGFNNPIAHAAQELSRYLSCLTDTANMLLPAIPSLPHKSARIVLGVADRFAHLSLGNLPVVHPDDDAFSIIPNAGTVYLIGANPRSVLYAAYRLLEEWGVVFLRPGRDGEVIPPPSCLEWPAQRIDESASYRHRGLCIEGYPRLEHVLQLLDWMVKKKMNTFHLEFFHAGIYWERGYQRSPEMDPAIRSRPVSEADCLTIDDRIITRAKELGMTFHRAGHGWTAATLGYAGIDWNALPDHQLAPEKRDWVALVNGMRAFWRNEPTNTELCYSNPEVREAFYQTVLQYAQRHPEIDCLHVWLSDATNNHCECEGCQERPVSDWYALLINEISTRLVVQRLQMKVVFLSYFDTLWPPETVPFQGNNLIFMYAPISRCYRHGICDDTCGKVNIFHRPTLNQCELPLGNCDTAQLAKRWHATNQCDSFTFEYYRWMPVWYDGMGFDLGSVIAQDMRDLHTIGMNGVISNDCIRAFYPTPYSALAMADLLWNRKTSLEAHRQHSMSAAFGEYAADVEQYFSQVMTAFRETEIKEAHFNISHAARIYEHADWQTVADIATIAQKKFLAESAQSPEPTVTLSLQLLALHAEQLQYLAHIHLASQHGDAVKLTQLRDAYEEIWPQRLQEFDVWVDYLIAHPVQQAFQLAEQRLQFPLSTTTSRS